MISALQLQGFRLRRLLIEPNNEFVFNEGQPQNDNSSLSFNFNFLQISEHPAFNVPWPHQRRRTAEARKPTAGCCAWTAKWKASSSSRDSSTRTSLKP